MNRRQAATVDTRGAGVKTVAAAAFVLVMALIVLLLVNARPAPDPFDPRSGRPDGTRGVVVTLENVGASVAIERSAPPVGADGRVIVFEDRLDDVQRATLLDFVESGGVAVVADPESSLHGGSGLDGGARSIDDGALPENRRLDAELEANLLRGDCTIEALADIRGLVVPDGVLFPVGPLEPRCFTGGRPTGGVGDVTDDVAGDVAADATTSFVIVRAVGDGLIIGLGDNEPFQNRWLRGADNAGLMAALLVPEPGAQVTVLLGTGATRTIDDLGSGDETLRDLVPTWAWMTMVLGAIAFVVFAASRATRLGRVLTEPVTTPIAGSELVSAAGNLMERAGHAPKAAWLVQRRLHRDLSLALRVPLDAPLEDLDRVVAERAGTERGDVSRVLRMTASGDDQLVQIAGAVRRLRVAVFGTAPEGDAPTPLSSDTDTGPDLDRAAPAPGSDSPTPTASSVTT
ncbi:MAG: DUF4350 domain-containing protein [Actinomycetota bacterium]